MTASPEQSMYQATEELPPHLRDWQLPPGWSWGSEGLSSQCRHYQEVIDALGRSLSLVSAPDPAHHPWLEAEARALAHRNHPAIPTTYHYWSSFAANRRGPGYLRRWIAGETLNSTLRRLGAQDVADMLRVLREIGSAISYLHDLGATHGCISAQTIWTAPMGRLWMLGWQWALPFSEIPGTQPDLKQVPVPKEWSGQRWEPTPASDQWQLAAVCFQLLTGELPPATGAPPLALIRGDCPQAVATVVDRALSPQPTDRYPSIAAMVRAIDRLVGGRTNMMLAGEDGLDPANTTPEGRLRWAVGEDYEVLASLGAGSFGSVWRVRDLSLGREVALKLLHPNISRDEKAVGRFRREAKLAAQLAHPAIVPIFDWDSRGDVSWYTMELAEGGSVADLIARSGPRQLSDVAAQIDFMLNGLAAAHAVGIVHRDLKPENVLIDRYHRWRLADFGIANAVGEEITGASGTPAFAPPEQLLGEAQDATADVFSAAGIVAFALGGTPPFGERDSGTILARALKGDIDVAGYAPEIADWLKRGLSPRREDRFADAGDMQIAWRQAVQAVFARERRAPWWRRWLTPDGSDESWTGESLTTA